MRTWLNLWFAPIVVGLVSISVTVGALAWAQAPAPAQDCTVELDKMRAYAAILKGDRDQKEAALAEYGARLRVLTAENEKLKAAAAK